MNKCRHLERTEAVALVSDGQEVPVEYYNCAWGDAYPARLLDMPRWVQDEAMCSAQFNWRKHCNGCAAYEPKTGGEG